MFPSALIFIVFSIARSWRESALHYWSRNGGVLRELVWDTNHLYHRYISWGSAEWGMCLFFFLSFGFHNRERQLSQWWNDFKQPWGRTFCVECRGGSFLYLSLPLPTDFLRSDTIAFGSWSTLPILFEALVTHWRCHISAVLRKWSCLGRQKLISLDFDFWHCFRFL